VPGVLPGEVPQILRDLNSWWAAPHPVRPAPPRYRRRHVDELQRSLAGRRPLIQVLRGPRQVGKTTALYQIVQDALAGGAAPTEILLVRFDLQPLQEAGLGPILRWYERKIRGAPLATPQAPLLLLDEIHKLDRWAEQVKHLYDTFHVRLVLTGSSSVLVARGQRESLAGRALTVDFPPFLFREVLECWRPELARALPAPRSMPGIIADPDDARATFREIHRHPAQRKHSWRRLLERYYNRGGYPRLYAEEGGPLEDRWTDYLVETVFDRVLGVDIPDLFPVEQPQLLRHIYLEVTRRTGSEVSQGALTQDCNAAGFRTAQPVVGRYLHYLTDAMLIREFRRYPLARARSVRVPVKITLTDLGVRNAIFRGAPSLWESAPDVVGPLVETLAQSVLRGTGLQVHFFRDYAEPGNRRSPLQEVDFVPESVDGTVVPVEVKFRQHVGAEDLQSVRRFVTRFKAPFAIVVTRDLFRCADDDPVICVPIVEFLLAF
jgi:predicted AAA+ superfamily ATPase